jgi:hypothetical protein
MAINSNIAQPVRCCQAPALLASGGQLSLDIQYTWQIVMLLFVVLVVIEVCL